MKGGFSLNALGYIDGEFYAVVAEGARRCGSVDCSATVAAENAMMLLAATMLIHRELLTSHYSAGLLLEVQ